MPKLIHWSHKCILPVACILVRALTSLSIVCLATLWSFRSVNMCMTSSNLFIMRALFSSISFFITNITLHRAGNALPAHADSSSSVLHATRSVKVMYTARWSDGGGFIPGRRFFWGQRGWGITLFFLTFLLGSSVYIIISVGVMGKGGWSDLARL